MFGIFGHCTFQVSHARREILDNTDRSSLQDCVASNTEDTTSLA